LVSWSYRYFTLRWLLVYGYLLIILIATPYLPLLIRWASSMNYHDLSAITNYKKSKVRCHSTPPFGLELMAERLTTPSTSRGKKQWFDKRHDVSLSAPRLVDEPFGCELRAERLKSSRSRPRGSPTRLTILSKVEGLTTDNFHINWCSG